MEIVPGLHYVDAIVDSKVYLWLPPDGSGRVVVIDTGMPGRAGAIWRYLAALGHPPEAAGEIWLTHGDVDHAGSAAALVARSGARVVAHRADVALVEGQAGRRWGRRPGGAYDRLANWAVRRVARFQPVRVDRAVEDGDDPGVAGASGWVVVHVPGHTPGSVCFHHPEHKIAVVGDALRLRLGRVRAPLSLFTPEMAQARESVARILALDFEVCCFGHGPPLRHQARRRIIADLPRALTGTDRTS